jgi:hypothetical protein
MYPVDSTVALKYKMVMNGRYVGICKDAVMAYVKVLSAALE